MTDNINQLQPSLDKATKNKENAETNALKLNFALTGLKQTTIKEHKILTIMCASLDRQVAKATKIEKLNLKLKAAQELIKYFKKNVHEETRKVDRMRKKILLTESTLASKSANVDAITYKRDALAKENEALLREVEMNVEKMKVLQETNIMEKQALEKQLQEERR